MVKLVVLGLSLNKLFSQGTNGTKVIPIQKSQDSINLKNWKVGKVEIVEKNEEDVKDEKDDKIHMFDDPTNVEDPIICYTTASTTATATPIPICLVGNTTTTCGANSNLFLSSLILKETTTIFARTVPFYIRSARNIIRIVRSNA